MENISKILENELSSSNNNVVKLRNLNKNPVLNSYLSNKQHEKITQAIIQIIENGTQTPNNINVLKFYLQEIKLIFNLNISQQYLHGVV